MSLLGYPKVIPYTKFEHFGIIRFWVILRTNKQMDLNVLSTLTDSGQWHLCNGNIQYQTRTNVTYISNVCTHIMLHLYLIQWKQKQHLHGCILHAWQWIINISINIRLLAPAQYIFFSAIVRWIRLYWSRGAGRTFQCWLERWLTYTSTTTSNR